MSSANSNGHLLHAGYWGRWACKDTVFTLEELTISRGDRYVSKWKPPKGKNTRLFLGILMVLWFLDIRRPRQWPQQFLRAAGICCNNLQVQRKQGTNGDTDTEWMFPAPSLKLGDCSQTLRAHFLAHCGGFQHAGAYR